MTATKLTALTTGNTIATVDTVCLVELQKVLQASKNEYHVLLLTASMLDDLGDLVCQPQVAENLKKALGSEESIEIGFHTVKSDSQWKLSGTVHDRKGNPLPGIRILAYDKDTVKHDDFLGCTFTDSDGCFHLGYDETDFKSEQAILDFEGNPDLYLDVTQVHSGVTKRTTTKGEAKKEEHFELKVDFASPTKMLRPVVGYYFIEEDKLEDEIESLKDAVKNDPDNAQNHFLLGLCFLEMIKSDLRKSEWMVPEIRSDDDVLAIAAIQEFSEVATLDPKRKEEADRYRQYVQELQNLAL